MDLTGAADVGCWSVVVTEADVSRGCWGACVVLANCPVLALP
jgi:hypothetical protein